MPIHYAITDFTIVIAGLIGARWLWASGRVLMAGGMICFVIPAMIGTVRISSRLIDQLAAMHSGSSALFGLTGVALLAAGLLTERRPPREGAIVAIIVTAICAVIFAFRLPLATIMGALLVVSIATGVLLATRGRAGWLLPVGFAVLLANSLFVRRAPWLSEAGAWHVFHLLIALGLVLVAMAASRAQRR